MQGVSLKKIGNGSCSVVEPVEVVGGVVPYGLKLSPRGNKWCPGWRELVAVLSVLSLPPVSCSAFGGRQLTAIDLLRSVNNPLLLFLQTDGQKYQSREYKQSFRY